MKVFEEAGEKVVEQIARMDLNERNDFVQCLVFKWPHMAQSLSNMVDLEVRQLNYKEKEAI
jgi:hypothetical protein|tara:strand:+ start:23491 stop:23673 length:183 start_codon:yes stop_codon:yes gene_type:complete